MVSIELIDFINEMAIQAAPLSVPTTGPSSGPSRIAIPSQTQAGRFDIWRVNRQSSKTTFRLLVIGESADRLQKWMNREEVSS